MSPSPFWSHVRPSVVRFYEDLPADAREGSLYVVERGDIYADCVFLRRRGQWMHVPWMRGQSTLPGSQRQPPPSDADRVRRRPVECGACGAPVSPHAERCGHCNAWLEAG